MAKPDLKSYRDRMDKAVGALKEEFAGLRTGRANTGLLDPVQVEAYGSTAPLNSVAAIWSSWPANTPSSRRSPSATSAATPTTI